MKNLNDGFMDSFKLGFLLSVKDEDRIDKFWHNEKGESIDCNISNSYYCPVLCLHEDGTFTNKNGIKIVKEIVSSPQTKRAESKEDFKEIYNREFKARKIKDTERVHKEFKDKLLIEVKKLIGLHEENRDFNSSLDIELISKANEFIEYLIETDKEDPSIAPPQIETQLEIEQPKPAISRTKEIIISELETLDKNVGWGYAFTSETDYNTFLNLLTNFFEYNSYTLPKTAIRLKIGCKTKLAITLNVIYKQLSEKALKSDKELFNIVRVLSHFKGLSDTDIYKAMTK